MKKQIKIIPSILITVIAALICSGPHGLLNAQENDPVSREKKRLMILPVEEEAQADIELARDIASRVASGAVRLGRYEVIDRNTLQSILSEQALQLSGVVSDSMIVDIGKIATAREAIIVRVLSFDQVRVEEIEESGDEDESGFFEQLVGNLVEGLLSGGGDEQDDGPTQTNLAVEIRKMDIETARTIGSYNIDVTATGKSRAESRTKVLAAFQTRVLNELKNMYLLHSQVVQVDGNEVLLLLGSQLGLREGTIFEIVEPDKEQVFDGGRTFSVPGRRTGFVRVTDLGAETNRSLVLRNWRTIGSGYHALEFNRMFHGVQLDVLTPFNDRYTSFNIQYTWLPVNDLGGDAGLRFSQIEDSRDEHDFAFGLNFSGRMRVLNLRTLDIQLKAGGEMDLVFRQDDYSHAVNAVIFSGILGLSFDLQIAARNDLILLAGYRFGGQSNNWTYSKDEETRDAEWDGESPGIDISGYYFSLGYKILIF
jgi:hypothetical protein